MAALGGGEFQIPKCDFRRIARHLQGIETFRDQFDDAGVVEVVPEGVVESLQQRGVLGVAAGGLEIGNGEANFLYAQAGAGANPILSEDRAVVIRQRSKQEQQASRPRRRNSPMRRLYGMLVYVHPFGSLRRQDRYQRTTISYSDMFLLAS